MPALSRGLTRRKMVDRASFFLVVQLLVTLLAVERTALQSHAFSATDVRSRQIHCAYDKGSDLASRWMLRGREVSHRIRTTTRLAADISQPGGGGTPKLSSSKVHKQMVKKKLQTFPRYLEVECWKRQDLRGLEPVLQAVASACKQINRIVQRAQTDDVYGVALDAAGNPLSDNVQGEVQQKLDVLCNTIMLRAFCGSGREIHSVASEEEDEPRCCSDVMVR